MIRRCAGSSAAERLRAVRPRRARWAASRREWLAATENLSALADLSGQWIDRVHGRRPPRRHRARHGFEREPDPWRAGDERLERPLRLHLLPPAVRVQPVRRSGALRAAARQRPQRRRLAGRARAGRRPLSGQGLAPLLPRATRPSPSPRSTSSWKPSGSTTRSAFPPTRSSRRGSATC